MWPKVLEQNGVIEWVEQVVKVMSQNGSARVLCDDRARAQVVGEVAADWASRLLGDVRLHHVTSAHSEEEVAAGCLVHVWIQAPFYDVFIQSPLCDA